MSYTTDFLLTFGETMPTACTAPCCPPTPVAYNPYKPKKKSMEDTMNNYTTIQADATDKNVTEAKYHITGRLSQIYGEKDREINKAFHLTDDARPKSGKEFMERIKAGMYVLPKKALETDEEDEDFPTYFSPSDFVYQIRWRDPAVKEDREGAKAARAKLTTAYEAAIDTAKVLDADKGLAALNEFKTYTIQ